MVDGHLILTDILQGLVLKVSSHSSDLILTILSGSPFQSLLGQQTHYEVWSTNTISWTVILPSLQTISLNSTKRRRVKSITSLFVQYQPRGRGNIDKFAFVQCSIPEWNTLPNAIVQANSTEQFRVLLEKHLQQNPVAFIGILEHTHTQVHLRD